MTKFLAFYHLRPIHDTKDFIGISEDKDNANIIVTIGRNVISITNVANQKEICIWTVFDKLSTKVVYDKESDNYVGVFGSFYLRCWNNEVTDINKIKKLKFKRKILDLIPSKGGEVLVLYANGFCESLSSAIENRKISNETDIDLLTNAEVFQSKLFNLSNTESKLFTYFLKNGKEIKLVTILLDEELKPKGDPKIYKLARHDSNLKLAGFTIVENQFSPCLMTIWSDKRIFMLSLDEKSTSEDSPGNFISMLDVLNTSKTLSIVGLSKHCVVIYGANTNQEEGSSLILFNTQYKVVKAKQFFKIYFDFSKLWVVNNYVLLAIGQNLSVITFNICQELLSDMIGSQYSNDNQLFAVDELINEVNEEYHIEENVHYCSDRKKSTSAINSSLVESIPTESADGKLIPFQPFQLFDEEYRSLCSQNMHIEFLKSNENCDELFAINLMSNCNADPFLHEEFEIISRNLKKYGASEQEISEKLITLCIKANLYEDIATCLRSYSNIYERVLVNVLKYALKEKSLKDIQSEGSDTDMINLENGYSDKVKKYECPENDFPNVDLNLSETKLIPILKPFDLVNLVLSCSFDTDLLSKYIRSDIEMDEALLLMQHLYNMIQSKDICLEERAETSTKFDNDSKLLQWFGVILSTHFQRLSLSREVEIIELLFKWNEILKSSIKNVIELQELTASLHNLVEKKDVTHGNKYSKWYTVESVKLF